MSASCSTLSGADLLGLFLLGGQPGVGEESGRGGGRPLPAGELLEHPLEVGELVDAVQPGGDDDAHEVGDVLELGLASEEEPELSPDGHAAQTPLGGVVVEPVLT